MMRLRQEQQAKASPNVLVEGVFIPSTACAIDWKELLREKSLPPHPPMGRLTGKNFPGPELPPNQKVIDWKEFFKQEV